MERRHVLIVTFPAQGHMNPSLQFAKRLTVMGIEVTFATSLSARRKMEKTAAGVPKGLNFVYFSDGFDDGFKLGDDENKLREELRKGGKKTLRDTIILAENEGRPVTCLAYTLLLSWTTDVARELHVPVALLWIQPAAVLGIYYYYFNGFEEEICSKYQDPNWKLRIPGFSYSLSKRDLPSFLLPSSASMFSFSAIQIFKEQFDCLEQEANPVILVNTFDALEPEILQAFGKYKLIGIGPLVPSSILDGKPPSSESFHGDLFENLNDDYQEWLNSKPKSSVIYISFGSILSLPKAQMQEISKALLRTKRPFLWVLRDEKGEKISHTDDELIEEIKSFGKIVSWCTQHEVLSHPSLGCFVSHCGWNSTLESLCCGVPMVAFPHWTDQGTNAKMIEEVWKTGIRVRPKNDEDGLVEEEEISRCIEEVMDGGEISEELKQNAQKLRDLAREAIDEAENGTSYRNLREFVGFGNLN